MYESDGEHYNYYEIPVCILKHGFVHACMRVFTACSCTN